MYVCRPCYFLTVACWRLKKFHWKNLVLWNVYKFTQLFVVFFVVLTVGTNSVLCSLLLNFAKILKKLVFLPWWNNSDVSISALESASDIPYYYTCTRSKGDNIIWMYVGRFDRELCFGLLLVVDDCSTELEALRHYPAPNSATRYAWGYRKTPTAMLISTAPINISVNRLCFVFVMEDVTRHTRAAVPPKLLGQSSWRETVILQECNITWTEQVHKKTDCHFPLKLFDFGIVLQPKARRRRGCRTRKGPVFQFIISFQFLWCDWFIKLIFSVHAILLSILYVIWDWIIPYMWSHTIFLFCAMVCCDLYIAVKMSWIVLYMKEKFLLSILHPVLY